MGTIYKLSPDISAMRCSGKTIRNIIDSNVKQWSDIYDPKEKYVIRQNGDQYNEIANVYELVSWMTNDIIFKSLDDAMSECRKHLLRWFPHIEDLDKLYDVPQISKYYLNKLQPKGELL
jgi:hypothetical protein